MPLTEDEKLKIINFGMDNRFKQEDIMEALRQADSGPMEPGPFRTVMTSPGQHSPEAAEFNAQLGKGAIVGLTSLAGGVGAARVAGSLLTRPIAAGIGEMVGAGGGTAWTGGTPREAAENAVLAGTLGLGVESAMNVGGRVLGSLTSMAPGTVTRTMAKPWNEAAGTMLRRPREGEAYQAGSQTLNAVEAAQGKLPQMRQAPQEPYQLSQREAEIVGRQTAEERALSDYSDRAAFDQNEALRREQIDTLKNKRLELGGQREQTATEKLAAKHARDEAIGKVGRDLETSLYGQERTATAGLEGKKDIFNQATQEGVTLNADELIQQARSLIPLKPTTGPRVAARAALKKFIGRVKSQYTKAGGDLTLDPIEADRLLGDIRSMVGESFGDINSGETSVAFRKLSRFWKEKIFEAVAGSGPKAAEIRASLEAREGLREYVSEKNPSGLVKEIIAGGPGSADRLAALREYETTQGTGGSFEKSINEIASKHGTAIKAIGERHSAGVEKINAEFETRSGRLREGDFKAKQALENARRAQLDTLKAKYEKELKAVEISQDLAASRRRAAFEKQPSTQHERALFESQERLRGHIGEKTLSKFVDNFRPGAENEDVVVALRDFEQRHGTGGRLEQTLRDLALRSEWSDADAGRAFSLWRTFEKFLAKPIAKTLLLGSAPVGRTAAGAAVAFNEATRPKKKPE